MSSNDNKFGGIMGGLKRLIFNDIAEDASAPAPKQNEVALQSPTAQPVTPEVPKVAPIVSTSTTNNDASSTIDEKELIAKIYQLFESINKPGVDFFELWNAAEAMGGHSAVNIQNAFTTFKVLGATKEAMLQSGRSYLVEIEEKMNADVSSKQREKDQLVLQLQQEKSSLQTQANALEKQIDDLKRNLENTKAQLSQVDSKFTKPIFVLDDKMRVGRSALNIVKKEISEVLHIVEVSVK